MVFAVIFFVCFIVVCSISSRHDDNFCKRNWSLFFHPYNEIMRALLHLNKKEKLKFLMFFDHLHSSVITIRLSKCVVSFQYDMTQKDAQANHHIKIWWSYSLFAKEKYVTWYVNEILMKWTYILWQEKNFSNLYNMCQNYEILQILWYTVKKCRPKKCVVILLYTIDSRG